MATDESSGRILVFGGFGSGAAAGGETWQWDGAGWTRLTPPASPPARWGHAMAWDSARSRLVLFGGADFAGTPLADTWEFDGSTWMQRFTATTPVVHNDYTMTFDASRGVAVLVASTPTRFGATLDVWEYDGNDWAHRPATPAPLSREFFSLAYDPVRRRTVMFGGLDVFEMNDTWEWDGAAWTLALPPRMPPIRHGAAMTYDPSSGVIVLFGGENGWESAGLPKNDTWAWDGIDWREIPTPTRPPGRFDHAVAYDPTCARLIAFGGEAQTAFGDTWALGMPPSLAGLSRSIGSEAGGDLVRLSGASFTDVPDTRVAFGGAAAQVLAVSCREAVVVTPPGTGVADVTLTNSRGSATLAAAFTRVPAAVAARFGQVGAALGRLQDVLLVNGSGGDAERVLRVATTDRLVAFLSSPGARPQSRYVVYGWLGMPDATTLSPLPHGLGDLVFPSPIGGGAPQPAFVLNTLGRRAVLGAPTRPSAPAPAVLFVRQGGTRRSARFAVQGLVEDDDSRGPDHVSATNAVIVVSR
jgi:IPT/TIG domain-containing protein